MRGHPIDLTGQCFGRLTVLGLANRTASGRVWEVECRCGNRRYVCTNKLRSGEHVSCGCLRAERMRARHVACRVHVVDGHKKCVRCKQMLPVESFSKSGKTLNGLQGRCKSCSAVYECRRKFGVTIEEAEALVILRQSTTCAVCFSADDLHIDHDHQTGRIRGILCGHCNRALGMLRDDPERILRLLQHLGASSA